MKKATNSQDKLEEEQSCKNYTNRLLDIKAVVIKYCSFGTRTIRPVEQNRKSGNGYIDIQRRVCLSIYSYVSRFSICIIYLYLYLSTYLYRYIYLYLCGQIESSERQNDIIERGGKRVFQEKRTFQYGCQVNWISIKKKKKTF